MRVAAPRVLMFFLVSALAVVALGWAAAIWFGGGFTLRLAGASLSSTNAWRPFAIGVAAAGAALWLMGPSRAFTEWRRVLRPATPLRAAIALASVTIVVSLAGNSWTASGPDSFAYLSQAALWRDGRLTMPVPLAANAPWPNATTTFAPFGYRAAQGAASELVPTTSPGVPMLMAAVQRLAGHSAAFLITPIAGGALVLLTFAIGSRIRSPAVGLMAAWLVATSPALLFMLMWPMTDVPAAACAALMIWLLLGESPQSALAAGLAASAGLLMRPNVIVIAAGAGVWLLMAGLKPRPTSVLKWRAIWFAAGVLPGALVMAWLNAQWYGSALASGYGAVQDLFDVTRLATNAGRYARWLVETSPLGIVGLAVLALPMTRLWPEANGRRAAWLLAITTICACGLYLFYEPYTEWWYLRFLLPAWPPVFVAAASALDAVRTRGRPASAAALAVVTVAGVAGVMTAHARGVFALGAVERRYVTVARLVEAATEPTAVILTCQHSGTIRYYAGRDTLRYDLLDPAWLDRAVNWLIAEGRHPYILVEDWEQPAFEARFPQTSAFGQLSFSPAVAWQSSRFPGWVFLYDPLRRDVATVTPGPDLERDQPLCARPAAWRR